MKEKILEQLKTKFVGVSETTLNRMAEKAAKTVTSEEQVTTFVDGVSFQHVIDSEADYRATKATQTSVENYEKKHNIKEGKPVENQKKDEVPPVQQQEVPEWAKPLLEFSKTFAEEKKQTAIRSTKEKLLSRLIELGAKEEDKKHLQSLIEMGGVDDSSDIEEKATGILSVYNSFKAPAPNTPPKTPDGSDDLDSFAELLKKAKGEN